MSKASKYLIWARTFKPDLTSAEFQKIVKRYQRFLGKYEQARAGKSFDYKYEAFMYIAKQSEGKLSTLEQVRQQHLTGADLRVALVDKRMENFINANPEVVKYREMLARNEINQAEFNAYIREYKASVTYLTKGGS